MLETNTLEHLFGMNSVKTYEFFDQNKDKLFGEVNVLKNGERLLAVFHQLQLHYIKDSRDIVACKKAIDFYYSYRSLLNKIDIKDNQNFAIFQAITTLNEDLENEFHTLLVDSIEDNLKTQPTETAIRLMFVNIDFAEELLGKSIAKLTKKPQRKYSILKSQLISELKKIESVQDKTTTPMTHNFESNFFAVSKTLDTSSAPKKSPESTSKPKPPQGVMPRVVPQLCKKSSAQATNKRLAEDVVRKNKRQGFDKKDETLSDDQVDSMLLKLGV